VQNAVVDAVAHSASGNIDMPHTKGLASDNEHRRATGEEYPSRFNGIAASRCEPRR